MKPVYLRLNPLQGNEKPTCTMFDIRDAADVKLITGLQWGEDFLVIQDVDSVGIVKSLLKESNYWFEEVSALPAHLSGYLS